MDFPNLVSVTRRAFASIKSVVSGFSDAQKSARTTAEHQGWIDGVGIEVSRFVIHGWAMSPDESPARVLCSYAGVPYCTAIADQYRPDVELTGLAASRARELRVKRVLLSLSHTHEAAIAIAVLSTD